MIFWLKELFEVLFVEFLFGELIFYMFLLLLEMYKFRVLLLVVVIFDFFGREKN